MQSPSEHKFRRFNLLFNLSDTFCQPLPNRGTVKKLNILAYQNQSFITLKIKALQLRKSKLYNFEKQKQKKKQAGYGENFFRQESVPKHFLRGQDSFNRISDRQTNI
jgi:hypothetical protein